jgi:hypothetical protein
MAFACAVVTVLLILWGVTSARASVVGAEAFMIEEGWSAMAQGDLRLAASSFNAAMDRRGLSSAPLEGLACVSWVAGYQDAALWNHQLYLALKSGPLSESNPCLGDLAAWGIVETRVRGVTQIFPGASDPDGVRMQEVATDEEALLSHRFGAMACLSHMKNLRLLASVHLQGLAVEIRSPESESLEPLPSMIESCVDGLLEHYAYSGNAFLPTDAIERFFVGHLSAVPPESSLVLPIPSPEGPDGRALKSLGDPGE